MTKNEKRVLAVIVMIFAIYNILTFVIGGFADHTAAFWTAYAFGDIAFIAVGAAVAYNFSKGLNLEDGFFGFPILKWSVIYLGIQLVLSVYVMMLQHCSYKIPMVLGILLLAAYVILIMICFSAKEHAAKVDVKTAKKTSNMKNMCAELAAIAGRADESVKADVEALAEKFRFSDPVSSVAVEELEIKMTNKIAELKLAVMNKGDNIKELCNELGFLVDERNIKCKSSKR